MSGLVTIFPFEGTNVLRRSSTLWIQLNLHCRQLPTYARLPSFYPKFGSHYCRYWHRERSPGHGVDLQEGEEPLLSEPNL